MIYIRNIDWDEVLPPDLIIVWQQLLNDLKNFGEIRVLRSYCFSSSDDPVISRELHGFSDASKRAYGCCIYLRTEFTSDRVSTWNSRGP